jgi:hypothetical protein
MVLPLLTFLIIFWNILPLSPSALLGDFLHPYSSGVTHTPTPSSPIIPNSTSTQFLPFKDFLSHGIHEAIFYDVTIPRLTLEDYRSFPWSNGTLVLERGHKLIIMHKYTER